MRYATDTEIEKWDELVLANPDGGEMLQCRAFADTKRAAGWAPRYVIHELGKRDVAALYLEKNLPMLGKLWYTPRGPGVLTAHELQLVVRDLKAAADGVFAVKIEPGIESSKVSTSDLESMGLQKVRNIQYNWATVVVDLAASEEDVINSFRQKTRYNIRLAERKGVTVEAVPASEDNLAIMYDLMAITTKRAGVYLRSRQYFYKFWKTHAEMNCGQLFLARYEGSVVAGAFITYMGHKALYKDGGSSREHANVQAPYAMQWFIMQWLKGKGVTEYDLHGTPPADRIDDASHPLHGLARFKTGFNEEITEYIGTYDLPLADKYAAWVKYGERLATAYSYRVKHELFY